MDITEEVLKVVESIPEGRVMSYGAIAAVLVEAGMRCSARQVGRVMAWHGGGVPWYRVVAANGRLPPGHEQRARDHLSAEGVTFHSEHVDMRQYAWNP
ncbi:MAG: cysteine methyltransferase [Corynebacteriales bacterium]|nr:cysteine methyltransferase [Mycobacteriales bacterium]